MRPSDSVGQEGCLDDIAAINRVDVIPTILEVICRTTGMGFAAVARVTEDRWIACAVRDQIAFGLTPGGELEVGTTICDDIRRSGRPVVIEHVAEDTAFRDHPTPKCYGFQSYISVPIHLSSGAFFGTLCAIDPAPARLKTPEVLGMFTLFANLIALHLDAQARLAVTEEALAAKRRELELQDEFVAVLGHDLRAPLHAVLGGADLLPKARSDEERRDLSGIIERSAVRMANLVDDILDFARARLGGGLPAEVHGDVDVKSTLDQVVEEARTSHPGRAIHVNFNEAGDVDCDPRRIGQLAANLLTNALEHGQPDGPVWIVALTTEGAFEVSVANLGEPIARDIRTRLFQPFARGSTHSNPGGGLGLGSYIASEIARTHRGTLTVTTSAAETRFTFRMPRRRSTSCGGREAHAG